jgi:hypothetical protein
MPATVGSSQGLMAEGIMSGACVKGINHMVRQETRDTGGDHALLCINQGPMRTASIPSKGRALNDVTNSH